MGKKLVPVLAVLAIGMVCLAGGAVLLELGLRLKQRFGGGGAVANGPSAGGLEPGPPIDYHPYLITYNVPNFRGGRSSTNSVGFRGAKEYPLEKEKGVRRVFVIGGSTAVGFLASGDEATIPAQLEKILNEKGGTRYEVINAAATGICSHQEIILTGLEILRRQPDVVVSFGGGTDALNSFAQQWVPNYNENGEVLLKMLNHSVLYHSRARDFLKGLFAPAPKRMDAPLHLEVADEYARNLVTLAAMTTVSGAKFLGVLQPNIAVTTKRLAPGEVAGRDRVNSFGYPNYGAATAATYDAMKKRLATLSLPSGASFLDASDLFGTAEPEAELFQDTVHFTDEGYRRAARILHSELSRRGFLSDAKSTESRKKSDSL